VTRRTKHFLKIAVIAGAVAFYFVRAGMVHVVSTHNGTMYFSRFQLTEEDPMHPRLILLRKREKLDEVVAPGKTQFEKIVLLRKWAHAQWEPGGKFLYPPWDAAEILDLARKQGNRAFCAQYAIVFAQAARALGLHVRYINLPGHFTVGVWSDEHNRWVVMDPTFDLHYERDGVPQRGRDLSRAYWAKDLAGLTKVSSDGARTPASREDIAEYKGYSILLRADHLAHPVVIRQNGRDRTLALSRDVNDYPVAGRDSIGFTAEALAWAQPGGEKVFSQVPYSDDPDDFRSAFNQTIIVPDQPDPRKGTAKVKLIPENSPHFLNFLISVNGGDYRQSTGVIVWKLKPGVNRLEARVATSAGWRGPVASVVLVYTPPLL
jgi:hypothetical protein